MKILVGIFLAIILLSCSSGSGENSPADGDPDPDGKEDVDDGDEDPDGDEESVIPSDGDAEPEGDTLDDDFEDADIEGDRDEIEGSDLDLTDITGGPEIPRWGLFESVIPLEPSVDNPFDSAEVDLLAEFRAPDRSLHRIPGFYYRKYSRSLSEGREELTADEAGKWLVRFSPTQQGQWRWRWRLNTADGETLSDWQAFTCVEPEAGDHGFIRVSPEDSRYLRYDDGTGYFAIGENLCWYDGRGTYAYDDWLEKLAARGVTYIRLWMPSWAFAIEWPSKDGEGQVISSGLGDYSGRLDRAWQLDYVIRRAGELGIAVMLCIQNHGPFSLISYSEWEDNPYNSLNGGPVADPADFFTNEQSREYFKRRLRYIVARWAHSPAVLAWELWNEVDLTEQRDPEILAAWHDEMASYIREIDPLDHPITTSTSGLISFLLGIDDAIFNLEAIDLAQFHLYGTDSIEVDLSEKIPQEVERMSAYGKPVLAAEAGVDFRGPAETLSRDPNSYGIHDILFSAILSGAFGSGMSWWWDNLIDPQDLYCQFGGASRLVQGVNFDREGFQTGQASVVPATRDEALSLQAPALQGSETVLVWIRDAEASWFAENEPLPVEGATLSIEGLSDGSWTASWINTYCETDPPAETVTVTNGELQLSMPPFTRDIALRLVANR